MSIRWINTLCFRVAMGSIAAGTLLGLVAIWFEDLLPYEFTARSLATTSLLFVASLLGALVTRLLVAREPKITDDDPAVKAMQDLTRLTAKEFIELRNKGEF